MVFRGAKESSRFLCADSRSAHQRINGRRRGAATFVGDQVQGDKDIWDLLQTDGNIVEPLALGLHAKFVCSNLCLDKTGVGNRFFFLPPHASGGKLEVAEGDRFAALHALPELLEDAMINPGECLADEFVSVPPIRRDLELIATLIDKFKLLRCVGASAT